MVRCITVSNLCPLHIDLDNAETTDKIGIDPINEDAFNSLVTSDNLSIEVTDIDNVAVRLYKVDIGILINYNESLGSGTPFDMGDISVTHAICLIVCIDALITEVILIETITCHHKKIVTTLLYLLYFIISHICFPYANLCR